MSLDWEVVQEKAFTAWVNGVLERVSEGITDISLDFSDGIKLVHFLELLSGKKIGKKLELDKKADIYKIQNVYLALQFAEKDMDVKAGGVAAEDFVNGNRKLILGFLWTLYRKYRIAVIKEGDKSSEEGLLQWCKNVTTDYDGVDIKNFKTGFRDGNAFLALAHKYDPSQFDYDTFSKESTPEQRLEKAFEIAEKLINIPKLLDAGEVMKGTADERSLILYNSLFFHAFRSQEEKQEAANKLGNLENSLSSAKQTREEMLRTLAELEKAKEELTQASTTKDEQIAELTEENKNLKAEVNELKTKGNELQTNITELQTNITELKTNITQLDSKSKGEQEDLSTKIDTAKGKIAELDTRIVELETLVKELKEKLEVSEKNNAELTEKLKIVETERDQLKAEKEEQKKALEGESEALKTKLTGESEALKTKLEAERDALTVKLEEQTKRADAEFSALLLLRQQFDQHVLDMHRWRKLLEVDNIADFLAEVRVPLEDELATQGGFDSQVQLLRGSLESETKDIQKYLSEKEDFERQRLKVDKKK